MLTRDISMTHHIPQGTEKLVAGTVWVNGMMGSWGYNAPFGGPKLTGSGRTNGVEGLDQYLVTKAVSIKSSAL